MASEDVLSFYQPFSSWISRVYEAFQQAGESLSSSLNNLGSKPDQNGFDGEDEDLEDSDGLYERYSVGSDDDSISSQESEKSHQSSSSCQDLASPESSDLDLIWPEQEGTTPHTSEEYFGDASHGVCQSYKSYQAMEALPTIPEEEEHLHSKQIKNLSCSWDGEFLFSFDGITFACVDDLPSARLVTCTFRQASEF